MSQYRKKRKQTLESGQYGLEDQDLHRMACKGFLCYLQLVILRVTYFFQNLLTNIRKTFHLHVAHIKKKMIAGTMGQPFSTHVKLKDCACMSGALRFFDLRVPLSIDAVRFTFTHAITNSQCKPDVRLRAVKIMLFVHSLDD